MNAAGTCWIGPGEGAHHRMIQPGATAAEPEPQGVGRYSRVRMVSADLAGFVVLAMVSVLAGLLGNRWRHQPLPLVYRSPRERLLAQAGAMRASGRDAPPVAPGDQVREIGLEEFQPFEAAREGLIIDARPAFFFHQGHVPGAINLSRAEFEADYRRLGLSWQRDRARPMAIYCSDAACPDSELVADGLRALGYVHLMIYKAGWEEWTQAGLPQEK